MVHTLSSNKGWTSTTTIKPPRKIIESPGTVEMQSGLELTRSKLVPPRLPTQLVPRPHLIERLNSSLTVPHTLVTAPAGFGKSTLLASWLTNASLPYAWLSLDEEENDVALFTAYVAAAVKTAFPNNLESVAALFTSLSLPSPPNLASALNNALAQLPGEFLLILDDFHVIQDRAVLTVVGQLLRHVPAPLHLVIASRKRPPFPLTGLRARGQLNELSAHDLRFSLEESSAFLQSVGGCELAPEVAELLHERAEGWPAALRFATLLMQQGCEARTILEKLFASNSDQFVGYMLTEVLNQQSPAVRQFLLQTAQLDDFTVGLAQAVVSRPADSDFHAAWNELKSKWQDSLLIQLDATEPTFRYHHLLTEFLHLRALVDLDATTRAHVHRRAAEWYAGHGQITSSLKHSLAAGDVRGAAQLIGERLFEMLETEQERPVLEEWLGLFPPEWLDQLPELLLVRMVLDATNQRAASLPSLIARLEQQLASNPPPDAVRQARFAAGLAAARTNLAIWESKPVEVLESVEKALEQTPTWSLYVRGSLLLAQGVALQMLGHSGTALHQLTLALKQDLESSPQLTLRVLAGVALVHLFDGNLNNMALTATTMLRLAKDEFRVSASWAHYFLGLAHYEWNHLDAAAEHWRAAADLYRTGSVIVSYASLGRLALTQQAQGLSRVANATWEELAELTDELRAGMLAYAEGGYRAELDLMQGETARSLRWAQSVSFPSHPHLLFEVEAHLARLRALAASRKPEHLRTLLEETRALLALAESQHNNWRRVELEALQAVALDKLGQTAAGLDALQRSVGLAEAGDMVRTFVDLGPRAARLLNLLLERRVATEPVQQILAASVPGWSESAGQPRELAESEGRWIEPLTRRELQVIEQLALRRMDKEIAEALVISPLTVKAHTEHIYRKLGVKSRHEAVKVALAFGILAQTSNLDSRL